MNLSRKSQALCAIASGGTRKCIYHADYDKLLRGDATPAWPESCKSSRCHKGALLQSRVVTSRAVTSRAVTNRLPLVAFVIKRQDAS